MIRFSQGKPVIAGLIAASIAAQTSSVVSATPMYTPRIEANTALSRQIDAAITSAVRTHHFSGERP